jgi:EAL domain-containing protein (putative c-di-GMP-specific phosphodiesterase class I)
MREKLKVKIELGDELRTALEKDALTLYYQPRINLETGQIVSLEALARWQHPTKGWIPPSTFIPLAEELGLIRQLGAQMLDKACAQVKTWEKANLAHRVAVNLSVEQLKIPTIVEDVNSILRRHALDAKLLELEITESAAMIDIEESIAKLQQFRDMGVKLAIDDFGTAYSSLAYLNRLPVDTLKIDRSFIKDMAVDGVTGSNGEAIVQTILALGKSLTLGVVAEGVETKTQYQALRRFGCDEAQGYLFAAPLNATAIEPLLERGVLTDNFNLAAAEPLT